MYIMLHNIKGIEQRHMMYITYITFSNRYVPAYSEQFNEH